MLMLKLAKKTKRIDFEDDSSTGNRLSCHNIKDKSSATSFLNSLRSYAVMMTVIILNGHLAICAKKREFYTMC